MDAMKPSLLRPCRAAASFFVLAAAVAVAQSPAAEIHADPAVSTPSTPSSAALLDRHSASIVEVAWHFKVDGELRPPPLLETECPVCGDRHPWDIMDELIEEDRPLLLPGFVLAPDRVLAFDPMVRTACVSRVGIRVPGRPGDEVPARAVASFPERGALLLGTDAPLPGAVPIEFGEAPAAAPRLCPFCKGEIAEDATSCPHCTSELPKA